MVMLLGEMGQKQNKKDGIFKEMMMIKMEINDYNRQ